MSLVQATSAVVDTWVPIISASGAVLISALAIIFNPVLSRSLKKLQESNNRAHQKINERIDGVDEDMEALHRNLSAHNEFIQFYVSEKETIKTLEVILRDALKYVGEGSKIGTYMEFVGHITIDAIKEILDIGLDKLTLEQLKAKLLYARASAFDRECGLIDPEFIASLEDKRMANKAGDKFVCDVIAIAQDTVNQKQARFRVLCEAYMQNLMRDMILLLTAQANKN